MRYLSMLLKALLLTISIHSISGCCWFKKCQETDPVCAAINIPSDVDTAINKIALLDRDRNLDALYLTSMCYNKSETGLLNNIVSIKPSLLLPVTLTHLAKFDGDIFSSLHLSSNTSHNDVIYVYDLLKKAWLECDKIQVNAFARATFSSSYTDPIINCEPLNILARKVSKVH